MIEFLNHIFDITSWLLLLAINIVIGSAHETLSHLLVVREVASDSLQLKLSIHASLFEIIEISWLLALLDEMPNLGGFHLETLGLYIIDGHQDLCELRNLLGLLG